MRRWAPPMPVNFTPGLVATTVLAAAAIAPVLAIGMPPSNATMATKVTMVARECS